MANQKQILEYYKSLGCNYVFYKFLSRNDNSKNQIYLNGAYEQLQKFPLGNISTKTPSGKEVRNRFIAKVDFYWVDPEKQIEEKAPGANLILYPKYP